MGKIENLARIEHPTIPLATAASFEDGLFAIRTLRTEDRVRPWRTFSSQTPTALFSSVAKGMRATCWYQESDELAGTTTARIIGRYLDEAYFPHGMHPHPASQLGWTALDISCQLSTATIAPRPGAELNEYTTVSMTEYIGSALYSVFHTLREIHPTSIRAVQCHGNEPKPFPG